MQLVAWHRKWRRISFREPKSKREIWFKISMAYTLSLHGVFRVFCSLSIYALGSLWTPLSGLGLDGCDPVIPARASFLPLFSVYVSYGVITMASIDLVFSR
jgi:hypothetical protein